MTQDILFVDYTAETAPDGSRSALRATETKLGFLPAAMARMAESPAVVTAFGRLVALWDSCSLAHREREVVAMTIAHHAGARSASRCTRRS